MRGAWVALAGVAWLGCAPGQVSIGVDAGAFDAGASDAGAFDAGAFDAGGPSDAGSARDAGLDAGPVLEDAGAPPLELTTTLAAETANDTSASDLFTDRYTPAARFNGSTTPVSNGDAPASPVHRVDMTRGAVSKVSVKSLLSTGATTRVFVETQAWFCTNGNAPIPTSASGDQCGSHIDVGYDSNFTSQVAAQMDDMISRGIDGAILDWDGTSAGEGTIDTATTSTPAINSGNLFAMLAEGASRGGAFKIAVMEDEGIRACAATAGCDVTQALIDDLDFLADHGVYDSISYYRDEGGRPFVFFFDVDGTAQRNGKTIDWARVAAGVRGDPVFIFENGGTFSHAQSAGAFLWVGAPAKADAVNGDERMGDVDWFYQQAQNHPSMHAFGSLYKGFDDLLVNGWGGGERFIGQQCGKTWLDTFAEANSFYSSSDPLDALLVMTWDDYEEGTEIESGIDNHVALTASVQGTVLSWSIAVDGDAPEDCTAALAGGWDLEQTIHHYVVFASPADDRQNLAVVADDLPPGTHSVDLARVLPAGDQVLFVKAVGQPSISNKLSEAVAYP